MKKIYISLNCSVARYLNLFHSEKERMDLLIYGVFVMVILREPAYRIIRHTLLENGRQYFILAGENISLVKVDIGQ